MLDFNRLFVSAFDAERDWGVKIVDNKDLVLFNKESLFFCPPSGAKFDSVLLEPAASKTFLAFNVKAIWGIICVTAK